jgi:hypothetical protein
LRLPRGRDRLPPGPTEILEGGRYGALVPPGDDTALADAMIAKLRAAPEPDALRARAADFSDERSVERYLELLTPARTRAAA